MNLLPLQDHHSPNLEHCFKVSTISRFLISSKTQKSIIKQKSIDNHSKIRYPKCYANYHKQKEGKVKIIAVAEYEGSIHNPDGIDMQKLLDFRKETGSIVGFPGTTTLENRMAALELECDILVPAALENQITAENAPRIKAKIIAEAANGPVTADAEDILIANGIVVIPDMYINAGGVTVSYFEWLKNLSHHRFGRMEKRFDENQYNKIATLVEEMTGKKIDEMERNVLIHGADEEDLVRSGLEDTMISSYDQIRNEWVTNPNNISMRTAAFVVALKKIGSDYANLGIFP